MSRKGKTPKRDVLPDPKYNDKLITKFINGIMREGKKSLAESILYKSLDRIKEIKRAAPTVGEEAEPLIFSVKE